MGMKEKTTMGVRETARRLGCTLKYIYDLLYEGYLPGKKVNGTWRIPVIAIEARLRARKSDGR